MQQVTTTPASNFAPAKSSATAFGASMAAQGAPTPLPLQQQCGMAVQGQEAGPDSSGMRAGHPSAHQPGLEPMEQANYDANANKATYAKRLRHGEEYKSAAVDGVQRAERPVLGAADPQRVNSNLPSDCPAFARSLGDQTRYTFNVDRGSFACDAYRNDCLGTGSFHGGMPGSMMMGRMGSMFGMGGPMRSMYGMGSMYGMNVSRPASLFGSMYGSQYGMVPMESMYSLGGSMNRIRSMYSTGSMYGMGVPMRSAMDMMGCPTGSMYGMNPGSQFGPNGFSSAYGDQFPNGMHGSQYNGTSSYGMFGVGSGYQAQPGYGPTGVTGAGEASGTNNAGAFPPDPVEQPGAFSSNAPLRVVTQTSGAQKKSSERKNAVVGLLVISADANPAKTVMLSSDPPIAMGADEIVRTGPSASATAVAITRSPNFQGVYNSVNAGHNTAVLLATDGTTESRSMATEVVRQVLAEALSETAKAAASHGSLGYYDASVSACALRSATEAIDCIEGAAVTNVEVGSHPVFGTAFMNVGTVTVRNMATHMPQVDAAITAACGRSDAKVVVIEAVVKQVRPSQKGSSPTDVLLSSIVFLVSNVTIEQQSYFEAFRNDANVPPALIKGCIGGACHTVAVLCMPNCTDPSAAKEAVASLNAIRHIQNSTPRSGNLARFIAFATGESDKMRQKPKVDVAVLESVDAMLADGRSMLQDPRNTVPVAYPSSAKRALSRTANTPQLSSRDINAHATEKGRDASNPIRVAAIASSQASKTFPQTFNVGPDGKSIADAASGTEASVLEVVTCAPEDWRSTKSELVNEVQTLFQNGNNTAIVGSVSPNEVNMLSKQPLWMAYKSMVSSLLSVAPQKYKFAEVSLSIALVGGNELLADLLVGMDSETPTAQTPQKLSVAYSPLFGPTVYKATTIKQPTALQLESTVNGALAKVPAIMQQHPSKKTVIIASAVMKGVTATDVYTSSMLAASALDPTVLTDILDKKPDVPHELFDYAFGGPCCTLFLAHVSQGDTSVGKVVELINRLNAIQNRSVRTCSVKKFIAFAEESLRRAEIKVAAAKSETEKETILRSKRSMEVFHVEYKTLIEDPEHHDPKTYRRSGGGIGSSGSGAAAPTTASSGASKTRSLATPVTGAVSADKSRRNVDGEEKSSERNAKTDDAKSSGSRHSSSHRRASADGKKRHHSSSRHSSGSRRSSKPSSHKHHHRSSKDKK
ncbi:conserved hypothetical protein [Leishmania mexicana MHOM/GT/2001/U1103]|uniref:Uncharacterized protein n=1 Tax=Leishmania mexicana (strain MHOM/GT/2001/U1103) TaxID=929439 RepID=E9B4D9_LEIMU|nr:conserved hypothetical protein [Leishmania mexicana MHOM/GT/2001/U1103]CBZ30107.1 conserved hypothetical protein [Leishmania mexicana MHOM/GT/2001/U1103]